ncbi:DUF2460 domain-containing protein [Mesorhizobium amorphae]|uniref:DUF2460 domain-containing protein n=1 Tax=Mesorhizobium amorphae TaxID=71433 RepID=UPI0017830FE8|nr:DUF2460 domain-containing protein [Mesorhizobium amorphae]
MTDTVAINDKWALDARMGPVFQTTVTPLMGGYEDRNQDWPIALWKYEVELRNRPIAEIRAFVAHLLGRRGSMHVFPLRDPLDNTLTDENIGTGNGVTLEFQIKKTYADDDRPYRRPIAIVSNLVVKVDGVTQVESVDFNTEDGWIGFLNDPPAAGKAITVSCDFLIPVRFEADQNFLTLPIGPGTSNAFASAGPFVLLERHVPKPDLGITPPTPMVYSYEGSTLDNSNLTTYTFAAKNVGAAGAGRVIALAVQTRPTSIGTPRSITGVTADGGAMTAGPSFTGGSSGQPTIAWFYRVIPTGTTVTFVVTFSNGTQNCAIGTYRLFPASSTPVDTAVTALTGTSAMLTDLEVKTQGLALILVDSGRTATPQLNSNSWGGVDTPIHDLTDQISDQNGSLNLFSIPTTENDTSRDFTATASGDSVVIAGMSFQ